MQHLSSVFGIVFSGTLVSYFCIFAKMQKKNPSESYVRTKLNGLQSHSYYNMGQHVPYTCFSITLPVGRPLICFQFELL